MHNPKNLKTIWLFLQLISFTLVAQDSSKTPYFDEVKIGNQIWMQKNLDVVTFRNGDTIPQVFGNKEWEVAGFEEKPAWCYYNYDSTNGAQYGKLYNWYAVNDSRGLAPEGWQIPSLVEWDIFKYEIHNLNDVHASCDGCKVKQADGWDLLDKSLKKGSKKRIPIVLILLIRRVLVQWLEDINITGLLLNLDSVVDGGHRQKLLFSMQIPSKLMGIVHLGIILKLKSLQKNSAFL